MRQRFSGAIAGTGSTSGVRVVVGHWHDTPLGAFSDAMVETAAGHRVLLAPHAEADQSCGDAPKDWEAIEKPKRERHAVEHCLANDERGQDAIMHGLLRPLDDFGRE